MKYCMQRKYLLSPSNENKQINLLVCAFKISLMVLILFSFGKVKIFNFGFGSVRSSMSNHHCFIGIVINQVICHMGDVKRKRFYRKSNRYYTLSILLGLLNVNLTLWGISKKFWKKINNSIHWALKFQVEKNPSALFIVHCRQIFKWGCK